MNIVIQFHVFILIFFLASSTTTAQLNFPLALPNCIDTCGDIKIPYPFGLTEGCYMNTSYSVACNQSANPPQLLFNGTNVQILNISLDGQLRMLNYISKRCYFPNGTLVRNGNSLDSTVTLRPPYTVNNMANSLTIVGCDSYGNISGTTASGQYFSTGCLASCREMADLKDGSCEGLGCCQIPKIPTNARQVRLEVGTFDFHRQVAGFNNCSYGFFADTSLFTFSPDNFTTLRNVSRMPMLIDWAVGLSETCRENASTNACGQNSKCIIPEDGSTEGYRCVCMAGYRGNPYLNDGCVDIDECADGIDSCTFKTGCTNHPGNYSCNCPIGYHGDGYNQSDCTCPVGTYDDDDDDDDDDGNLRDHGCRARRESQFYKLIAGAAVGVTLLLVAIALVDFVLKRRRMEKMKHLFFLRNGGALLEEKLTAAGNMMKMGTDNHISSNNDVAKIFSSKELKVATNNFHNSMIIGEGGFGTVYKGCLQDKRIVAIKKSKEVDANQIDQFINEVAVLSQVGHRNIVKLLGCCLETQAPLLVYEFICNGTLDDHIHNNARKRFLDWKMRLKIASETADVLSYLHSAASIPIIHRDVKSANILLDQNFDAKVADFGASRLVPIDQTQLSTMVQGTFGYLDPEYMQTNQLTEKSDVYSFGVVLLELLTGMKPLSYDRPEEERNLTSFFLCRLHQGRLLEVLDETIVSDKGNVEQLTEVANLARVCLHVKGHDRPTMKQVAMELEALRSGGRQSWAKLEENVEEKQPSYSHILDDFENDIGFSTSMQYHSLRDPTKLKGGR